MRHQGANIRFGATGTGIFILFEVVLRATMILICVCID